MNENRSEEERRFFDTVVHGGRKCLAENGFVCRFAGMPPLTYESSNGEFWVTEKLTENEVEGIFWRNRKYGSSLAELEKFWSCCALDSGRKQVLFHADGENLETVLSQCGWKR